MAAAGSAFPAVFLSLDVRAVVGVLRAKRGDDCEMERGDCRRKRAEEAAAASAVFLPGAVRRVF